MDLACDVFVAAHVDDLIVVASSSQLNGVVSEMKQCFPMQVTRPLSASAQTYVGARYLRRNGAIGELPTTCYVESMLQEHGVKDVRMKTEATREEHQILRRLGQFFVPRRTEIAFAVNRLARSLHKPTKAVFPASKRTFCYICGTLDLGLKLLTQCPVAVHFNVDFVWHVSVPKVPAQLGHRVDVACQPRPLHLLQLQSCTKRSREH